MKPIDLSRNLDIRPPDPFDADYPSLYLDFEGCEDLPESGTMTVRFKKRSSTVTERDGETEHAHVDLVISEILNIEEGEDDDEKGKKRSTKRGEHLDILRKETEGK